MKIKNRSAANDSGIFWETSKKYISNILPDVRKTSMNTVLAYRQGLNAYIDYMESEKGVRREDLTFADFSRTNLIDYLDWMLNVKKYGEKTCDLRITTIHSLLEYASNEYCMDLMAIYKAACTVKGPTVKDKPIEYFEPVQMKALLAAPNIYTKTGRRNQMMLILYYDTAARCFELLDLTLEQIHIDAAVPYITILGKGRKYRNIPLSDKTVAHLKRYLNEFHSVVRKDSPLFYAQTHGEIHSLSNDTVETMIKKYAKVCVEKGLEMPERAHCHMIRKTRAMDLYKSNMPLAHIQQLLGHEDMSTTSGFYAFATLDTLAKSMEVANKASVGAERKWKSKEVLKQIYKL